MLLFAIVCVAVLFGWLWYDHKKETELFEQAREKSLFQKVDEQLIAVQQVTTQQYEPSPPSVVEVKKPRKPRTKTTKKKPSK